MPGREGLPFGPVGRRIAALIAVAVVVFAAIAFVLARNSSNEDSSPKTQQGDPRSEALAYAPKASPALIGVDTGSPEASLVLGALVNPVSRGAATPHHLPPPPPH